MDLKMTQPNQPQTSQEQGPREFFLSPNKIKTALAMVPHYIAFDKAQTQESIHTIEIRAYQSLQQKVAELEAELKSAKKKARQKARAHLFKAILRQIEEIGVADTIDWITYRGQFEIKEAKALKGEEK